MSDALKHQPDYYSGGYLVEVVGCGNDRTLKFRTSKAASMDVWHEAIQPVAIFIYNSTEDEYACLEWSEFKELYDLAEGANGVQAFSSDGNTYVPISFEDLLLHPQVAAP